MCVCVCVCVCARAHTHTHELTSGKGDRDSILCLKDVCQRDMEELDIDVNRFDELASDRSQWRQDLDSALKRG